MVSSFLLQTAPIMNFGAVYDIYGEPDYLGGEQVNDEQGYMALVYSEVPLILYAFVANPPTGAISVTSQIIGTMYLGEAEMQELLTCAVYTNGRDSWSSPVTWNVNSTTLAKASATRKSVRQISSAPYVSGRWTFQL